MLKLYYLLDDRKLADDKESYSIKTKEKLKDLSINLQNKVIDAYQQVTQSIPKLGKDTAFCKCMMEQDVNTLSQTEGLNHRHLLVNSPADLREKMAKVATKIAQRENTNSVVLFLRILFVHFVICSRQKAYRVLISL
jgi:hypothetical protein